MHTSDGEFGREPELAGHYNIHDIGGVAPAARTSVSTVGAGRASGDRVGGAVAAGREAQVTGLAQG